MPARVRPSGLDLTVACPGSLQLQERVAPCPTTFEQAEGTGAHTVALKHASGAGAEWGRGRKFEVDGIKLEVDDDMLDGAAMYRGEAQSGGRFEETVAIPDVHPTECAGTPDYWRCIIETFLRLLKVIDYKFGHRFVEVWECWQLVAYAAGVARFLNLPADFPVMLVIVQPRCYSAAPIREWQTTVGGIIELCHTRIWPQVALALGPNPPTVSGRHCQDCRARHACVTYQRTTESLVDFSGTAEIHELDNRSIGQELRLINEAIKRLEGRKTGLYAQANNLARAGQGIPFWKLEPPQTRRRWKDDAPADKVAAIADLLGIDIRKPLEVVTPTQAIAAGIDEAIIEKYSERPRGALRLVPDDTTRLRKIFGVK